MKQNQLFGRRKFIKETAAGAVALSAGLTSLKAFSHTTLLTNNTFQTPYSTGFDQQPLPYAFSALEPVIDALTMEIHYSKHAAGYAKNVKEAALAEKVDMNHPLEQVLVEISRYSAKMRNNAGGHYNHELFWQCMCSPVEKNIVKGKLLDAITTSFSSFDAFKSVFTDAAKSRFGSGWAWLYVDMDKKLKIGSTANQDNPLMDNAEIKGFPLLGIDVWEHAYYLKYQNKRTDYIENWWKLVNWNFIQTRFEKL